MNLEGIDKLEGMVLALSITRHESFVQLRSEYKFRSRSSYSGLTQKHYVGESHRPTKEVYNCQSSGNFWMKFHLKYFTKA